MQSTNGKGDVLWTIPDESLHLIGKPGQCFGQVNVCNRSSQKVRIKRLPLAEPGLRGPGKVPVTELQLFARIPPGATAQVQAHLPIPPHTPPGRYTGEVVVGDVTRRAIVDVLESWELGILPAEISLKLQAGNGDAAPEPVKRLIQLINRGNMPWSLRRSALASLEEEDGVHRNVFQSFTQTEGDDYQTVLNDFVRRMRETEVEPARIRFLGDADVIQPGDTRNLEIEIAPPKNLKRNRRYTGSASFENAVLFLDIEIVKNSTPNHKA